MSLRRKTPLKRGGFAHKRYPWARNPKPRKPWRKQSAKMTGRLAVYYRARAAYLREHAACLFCLNVDNRYGRATEIHHKFGRGGSLLCDVRGFVACCRAHRDYPNEHPVEARALGLLGAPQDYGVPIDRHRK